MAIEANTSKDWGMRGATNTTLPQFKGKPRQLIVNIDDGYRPIIMDGITLGGKFKSASLDELNTGLAEKLGKTEKAESAKTADSIDGANVTGTVVNATNATYATYAIKATQDNHGNDIYATYATRDSLSLGLSNKLNINDIAAGAQQDDQGNNIATTYLKKTDAANTYLGKTDTATTALNATKAVQDQYGNNISSTYMKKSSITYGTSDLIAGSSTLATGSIYLVYE